MNKLLSKDEPRTIIAITGALAQGKTLAMVALATEMKEQFDCNLYSNFALIDSQELNLIECLDPSKPIVICIDEFSGVLHRSPLSVYNLLAFTKNKYNAMFINSIDLKRLPVGMRNLIDVHLHVTKLDGDTIEVKGVNVAYERTLKISESADNYNAFEATNLVF